MGYLFKAPYWLCLLSLSCSLWKRDQHQVPLVKEAQTLSARHHATSSKAVVATQGNHATSIGLDILAKGGNVIDAAVAVSFAISVERPQSTGLGGGGFMLFYLKGMAKPLALDFREMAPASSHRDMYLDKHKNVIEGKSLVGGASIGVPGLVAGLWAVHERYGKIPWSQLLIPAIKLAEEGFIVYPELEEAIVDTKDDLLKFASSRRLFFKNNQQPLRQGDRLVQKDLAQTLTSIAQHGPKGFYEGDVAMMLAKSVEQHGGKMTKEDLAEYHVRWRNPVEGSFRDHKIYSMSPPSSGGVHILQILNTIERDPLESWGVWDERSVHVIAMAMQAAFADRAAYLGDPDFSDVPIKGLVDKFYGQKIRSTYDFSALKGSERKAGNPFPYESNETTHFSLMDNEGNTVVSTQTINGHFGSALVAEGTGVVLNNEMDDFAAKVGASNLFGAIGGEKNLIAPGKRPLSSMSPTIVFHGKKPVMGLGTPSGTRILTCVAQTIINRLAFKLPLYEAVGTVRFHQQWSPDELHVEENAPSDIVKKLKALGHNVVEQDLGCRIQAVERTEQNVMAVSDMRGEGSAGGL